MSERAIEFVETWVSEKIDDMEELPAEGDETQAKALAAQCLKAARDEGIPDSEIKDAFDDLAEFIEGQIEETREREEDEDDEDDEEEEEDEEEDGGDDNQDDEK